MDGLSRKEQIKNVSARMFRKRGFSATSMRDIASEMGIEAPSLYNHISSKHQILEELLMMVAKAFTKGMDEIKTSPLSSLEKLERLVKLHVDITMDHTDAVSLLTNEWVHLQDDAADIFNAQKDRYEKEFKKIVKTCIDEGQIPASNVDLVLFSMLSTLRWLYSWYSKNQEVNRIVLEQEMIRLLIPRV